jgi:hypothetical protein
MKMMNERPEVLAADYWNLYLEHNRLRTGSLGKGPDTDAGAFLAMMLENSGDILRESAKSPPDRGYQFEKFNRLKRYINDRDWKTPISPGEQANLKEIQRQVNNIPTRNEMTAKIKTLILAVSNRAPGSVDSALNNLKPLLQTQQTVTAKQPPSRKTQGSEGHWKVIGNKWVHFPD